MERFEKPSLKETLKEEREDNIFDDYVRSLKLTPEDLAKNILDVGASTGEFAAEAKRRGYGNITSIDIDHPAQWYEMDAPEGIAGGKMVVADAREMPFADEQFDIAISKHAMPHAVLSHKDGTRDFKNNVDRVLREMLRVTKEEVRITGIPLTEDKSRMDRGEIIERVLKKLEKEGIEVTREKHEGTELETDQAFIRLRRNRRS